jgi:hypothetical protein
MQTDSTANLLTGRHAVQFRRVTFNCAEVKYRFQVRFRMFIQPYYGLYSIKQTMTNSKEIMLLSGQQAGRLL